MAQSQKQQTAREAARAQVAAIREAQAKRERRIRNITIGALAGALLVLISVFLVVVIPQIHKKDAPLGKDVPAGANADGGFSFGADGTLGSKNAGAPVIEVYADFICPGCAQFESANAAGLDKARQAGEITLVLHPVSILDRFSLGTQYSTRAVAAFALVADKAPGALIDFNTLLFHNQPSENTAGLSNAEIAQIAAQAGAPDAVANEIADGTAMNRFGGWVQSTADAVAANPNLVAPGASGFGTPTVTVNGEVFTGNWLDPEVLLQAAADAKAS